MGGDFTKPSRESMREVKREARQRRRSASGQVVVPLKRPRGARRLRRLRRRAGEWAVAGLVIAGLAGAGAYTLSRMPSPAHRLHRRTAAPVVVPSYTPPPKNGDVFAGSPVARWPIGANGIKPPTAAPFGRYSAAQVADAYSRAATLLRTAMLDERVLYHGETAPVLRLMEPGSRTYWTRIPAYVMTRFDPKTVARASATVRVNGRMTVKNGRNGLLRVEFTYVSVYALRPAPAPGAHAELVAIRRTGAFDFRKARDGKRMDPAPWASGTYVSDHSRCELKDPDDVWVTVHFESATATATPTTRSTGPLKDFDILNPTATPPPGQCFNDTSGL